MKNAHATSKTTYKELLTKAFEKEVREQDAETDVARINAFYDAARLVAVERFDEHDHSEWFGKPESGGRVTRHVQNFLAAMQDLYTPLCADEDIYVSLWEAGTVTIETNKRTTPGERLAIGAKLNAAHEAIAKENPGYTFERHAE